MTEIRVVTEIEPSHQKTWGIIRYAAGSAPSPENDASAFDGWYGDKEDALVVAKDWVARYPKWIVGLVCSELVWFGEGDFSKVQTPLTAREVAFLARNLFG